MTFDRWLQFQLTEFFYFMGAYVIEEVEYIVGGVGFVASRFLT